MPAGIQTIPSCLSTFCPNALKREGILLQHDFNESSVVGFFTAVTFLLTEKIEVKGDEKHPIYSWLTDKKINGKSSSTVKWNFQKYIVDEKGEFVNYFYSTTKPLSPKITSILK